MLEILHIGYCCWYHDAKKLLWEIILANASPKGGRIDAAHHNGHAVRALSETLAFDKAIEVKLEQLGGLGGWSSHHSSH